MTPSIFPRSLLTTYYSLKITGIVIIVLYIIIIDVIVIYPKPISCRRDGGPHYSLLT